MALIALAKPNIRCTVSLCESYGRMSMGAGVLAVETVPIPG